MSKKINGTPKADIITVKESSLIVRAGKGKDKITVIKGHINEIHGDADNDIITIKSKIGKTNEIYGDAGNDKISIAGGTKNKYYGGAGKDTITITGGKKNVIHGNAGVDTFNLQKSVPSGNKIYGDAGKDIFKIKGGNSNFIYGGNDSDAFTITAGKKNEIYGNAGADKYTISGSATKENMIYGDAGNDIFTIKGGSNNKIYGGKGNDKITVTGGSNLIDAGVGNDKIIINGGKNRYKREETYDDTKKTYVTKGYAGGIFGGSGNDKITVNGGINYINAGVGDDVINVNGGNHEPSSTDDGKKYTEYLAGIFGGNGNDTITVKDVSNSEICGGVGPYIQKGEVRDKDGNDTITVTGGSNNGIYGGNGNDTITVNGGSTNYISGAGGNDTITVNNAITSGIWGNNNSVITVTGGQQNSIYTSDNVKLYVKSGSGHEITDDGYQGKSYIEITQANNVNVVYKGDYQESDTDYAVHTAEIVIKGGTGNTIGFAGEGATVSITGGSNHTLKFKVSETTSSNWQKDLYGTDNTINVTWAKGIGTLNVYEGDDSNLLNFSNVNSSIFEFKLSGENLVLTDKSSTGDKIIFNDWAAIYGMPELKFQDKSYSYYDIEEKLGLNNY